MSDEVTFSPDLFRGKAQYYDRFRLPYPDALISDLVHRTGASGQGRLLDLACGTGQLAFALRSSFAEVWAADQEPEMVAVVAAKAAADPGAVPIRTVVASAEELDAPPAHFSVVVIGNAFHRLPRDLVAGRVHGWLQPDGFLALCWSLGTQAGPLDWQVAFGRLLSRWQAALGGGDRVPANWDRARRQRPDADVLTAAGLERRPIRVSRRAPLDAAGTGRVRAHAVRPPDRSAGGPRRRLRRFALCRARPLRPRRPPHRDGQLHLRVGSKRPLCGGLGSASGGRTHAIVGRHDDSS